MEQAVVLGPGEGEALFGGRIVLKVARPELTVTESLFPTARPGASLHLHREHADAFVVLEGRLSFLLGDEEHEVGPGGVVVAPPGVPHGFRSLSAARFLNVHTPDGGFADALRERDGGGPGRFDSVDVPAGAGLATDAATLLARWEGSTTQSAAGTITVKADEPGLRILELDLAPGLPADDAIEQRTIGLAVLEGEAAIRVGDTLRRVPRRGFVEVPPGVPLALGGGPIGARVLQVLAAAETPSRAPEDVSQHRAVALPRVPVRFRGQVGRASSRATPVTESLLPVRDDGRGGEEIWQPEP